MLAGVEVSPGNSPMQEQLECLLPGEVKAVKSHRVLPGSQPILLMEINITFMSKGQKVCFKRDEKRKCMTCCVHQRVHPSICSPAD